MTKSDPFVQRVRLSQTADPDTHWWWERLADGEFLIPHCISCDGDFFPPIPSCPYCGSSDIDRITSSGEGTVYSWIVVHESSDPVFQDLTPYTIVAVHLTEGVRIFGRIAKGQLESGMPVRAVPYTAGSTTVLGFRRT